MCRMHQTELVAHVVHRAFWNRVFVLFANVGHWKLIKVENFVLLCSNDFIVDTKALFEFGIQYIRYQGLKKLHFLLLLCVFIVHCHGFF